VLIRAGRFDAAVYLCGYAVEISLKARICRTLRWTEFPNEPRDWRPHHAFLKIHDLRRLARWSGYAAELERPPDEIHWLEVNTWNPETRYELPGKTDRARAIRFLRATRTLADRLNPRWWGTCGTCSTRSATAGASGRCSPC
jgi:hypothetical protein